jgi:pimeloyl-ACP methyl ester carboxylesterase
MPQLTTPHGVALEYETVGSPADPPLLLVPGFGAQLIAWPRAFCERLAAGRRFVITFDNRDSGLSSKLDGQGADLASVIAATSAGDFEQARALAAYTLSGCPTTDCSCFPRSGSSERMCSAPRWAE